MRGGREQQQHREQQDEEGGEGDVLEHVLEHVFKFLTSDTDRNNASLVCKSWCRTEAQGRRRIFIGNCYSVSPEKLTHRFHGVSSVTLKGKPRFSDFDLVPSNWGAHTMPWIEAFCSAYPSMEELKLKRMTVSDSALHTISTRLHRFKRLTLITCDGFTSSGLASIVSHCRSLETLDLTENKVENLFGNWVAEFPTTCTSLVSLNLETVHGEVDVQALTGLVERCTRLKSLKLSSTISLKQMEMMLQSATQLVELGTGSFSQDITAEELQRLQCCVANCRNLSSLSGFWDVRPGSLAIVYPACSNLTSLNLSYTPIDDIELAEVVSHCHNLQRLWIMDSVEDRGLKALSLYCRGLKHLRVYPRGPGTVTEEGLVAISEGCPNLISILYFCGRMTNRAIMAMATNCPLLESFRLATLEPRLPDPTTNEPMDEGFGAIVRNCQRLRRLALSGLLTDRVFEYIGNFGKRLQRLSLAFADGSDRGLKCVLRGCTNLFKLEIRDCPFGDDALLAGCDRYESMRSLWMSNCRVTMQGCMRLAAEKRNRLIVEVIKREGSEDEIDSVYVYRAVTGHRNDVPPFVTIL